MKPRSYPIDEDYSEDLGVFFKNLKYNHDYNMEFKNGVDIKINGIVSFHGINLIHMCSLGSNFIYFVINTADCTKTVGKANIKKLDEIILNRKIYRKMEEFG